MAELGTIRGTGILDTNGDREPVTYQITVTRSGAIKDASGTIAGPSRALMAAFNASSSKLELEGGGEITVIVTQIGTPGGQAQVKVSGPVPGF